MRETRLSGSEGGAGSIPVPTPIVAWVDPRGDLALLMSANSTVANEIHHA